ncbi:MAG: hypothetical protein DHS20C15_06100 [Planctomycetota bacterium]|nr:MAG: hypothetical protein DHS20C15_06100 [Planctomycetota bacterium]
MSSMLALQDAATPFVSLDPNGPVDIIGAWLMCFLTLSVFSFLYKDNPFYKVAEHVFVGVGTAYFALQYYKEGILEPVRDHMYDIAEVMGEPGASFSLGGYDADPTIAFILRAVAAIFGLMLLTRLFSPNSWAPRWPLAVMVGVYSALKLTGETQSKLVLQTKGLMKPLVPENVGEVGWFPDGVALESTPLFLTIANAIVVIGVICALSHFLFTWKRGRTLGAVSRVGIIVLMITFGSMFGFTVLGRIALLIERVNELFDLSEPDYAFGTPFLSPPVILTVLIAGTLTLFALQRKEGTDS